MSSGLDQYAAVRNGEVMEGMSPHRVTQLMLETLATRIAEARGHCERGEIEARGTKIAKGIALIEGLVLSLDLERGGDIAANLQSLYEYLARRLVTANLDNSLETLDEASALVGEIKAGWDGIATAAASVSA